MRILFCNVAFRGRSGTETYLADLVPAIRDRGHDVACLTTTAYPIDTGVGRELTAAGIQVTQDPADVPWTPDVIHGHHRAPTTLALERWPSVPTLFFVHDAWADTDAPLVHDAVAAYVAVDDLCAVRLTDVHARRTHVIPNAVDLDRFRVARRRPRRRPRRALLFMGHAPDMGFVPALEEACGRHRIRLSRLALGEAPDDAPETKLGAYDLCFARGRSALEAMASGLGVICVGYEGLGPLVTPAVFDAARRLNFGRGLLEHVVTPDAVSARIAAWDRSAVAAVTARVRGTCGLPHFVDRLLALYADVCRPARN